MSEKSITYKDVKGKQDYRERCINKKGEKCEICGNGEKIEVHHIDGDRYNNVIENLIPVCHECHNKIHTRSSTKLERWTNKLKALKERKISVSNKKIGKEMGNI